MSKGSDSIKVAGKNAKIYPEVEVFTKQLFDAIIENNISAVDKAIKGGADINEVRNININGELIRFNPIRLAVACDRKEIVKILINNKVEIDSNVEWDDQKTTAALAAENGYAETLGILLRANAEINGTENNYKAPLLLATKNGHSLTVAFLLHNRNINVNVVNQDDHKTPLHIAASNGAIEIVRSLINKGANPEANDANGCTPILLAALNGYDNVVHFLRENGSRIDVINNQGFGIIDLAALNGHMNVIHKLSDYITAESLNGENYTPLINAVIGGHKDIVDYFLDLGTDVNSVKDGWYLLNIAANSGYEDIVEMLLKHGAGINFLVTGSGWSSVMLAANQGYESIVKTFLENGAIFDPETLVDIASKGKSPNVVMPVINEFIAKKEVILEDDKKNDLEDKIKEANNSPFPAPPHSPNSFVSYDAVGGDLTGSRRGSNASQYSDELNRVFGLEYTLKPIPNNIVILDADTINRRIRREFRKSIGDLRNSGKSYKIAVDEDNSEVKEEDRLELEEEKYNSLDEDDNVVVTKLVDDKEVDKGRG